MICIHDFAERHAHEYLFGCIKLCRRVACHEGKAVGMLVVGNIYEENDQEHNMPVFETQIKKNVCSVNTKESRQPILQVAGTLFYILLIASNVYTHLKSHRSCRAHEPSVNAAAYSKEQHACGAEGKGSAGGTVAAESGQRSFGLVYIHALHNLQIVVE